MYAHVKKKRKTQPWCTGNCNFFEDKKLFGVEDFTDCTTSKYIHQWC